MRSNDSLRLTLLTSAFVIPSGILPSQKTNVKPAWDSGDVCTSLHLHIEILSDTVRRYETWILFWSSLYLNLKHVYVHLPHLSCKVALSRNDPSTWHRSIVPIMQFLRLLVPRIFEVCEATVGKCKFTYNTLIFFPCFCSSSLCFAVFSSRFGFLCD